MVRNASVAVIGLTVLFLTSAAAPLAAAQSVNETNTTTAATSTTAAATETTVTQTATATETTVPTATATETDTASPTETTAMEACEPAASSPKLANARLYAPQKTITADQTGQIAGGFRLEPTANCPIVVDISMSVPSGMSISGSSDVFSTGAGITQARFVVDPDSGVKDIRAEVFAQNTGDRTVTADITYWPQGHEEMAQEMDGIQLTFDVEAANTPSGGEPDASESSADSTDDLSFSNPLVVGGVFGTLLLVAIVGLAARN